jgi:hypothetical protein
MEFDFEMILTSIVVGIIGSLTILLYIEKLPSKISASLRFLLGGMLILLFAAFGNSLVESHREFEYMFDFLSLKKVGRWFFRLSASLGYITIMWGIAALIGITFKKFKKRNKKSIN